MTIRMTVNGEQRKLDRETPLPDFLRENGIDPEVVVVEYNYDILDREKWKDVTLTDGDNLEILQLVGGG